MAAGDGKSLNSGISIPQWMKSRINDTRLDFDESTFSPPDNDDSFLYIRYPEVTRKLKSPIATRKNQSISANVAKFEVDLVNHTAPYQPNANFVKAADIKVKSNGTDDGFKGEGAACGSSVIRVAHQMVSGRYPINSTTSVDEDPLRPKTFDPSKRRGSKSLPVTPISSPSGSPKSRRRLGNKYFTGPFMDNENPGGSWILQGLLSKRDISQSMGFIPEETSTKGELEKAVSDFHIDEPQKPEIKIKKQFKPKPSEFREMNFWSPTSM